MEVITNVISVSDDVYAVDDDDEYTGDVLSIINPEVLVKVIELRNKVVVIDKRRLGIVLDFKVLGPFEGMTECVPDLQVESVMAGSPRKTEGVDGE